MTKMLRAVLALSLFTLCTTLFAGSRTWDIGGQSGPLTLNIEMFEYGDYTFVLYNKTTSQTVAVLYSLSNGWGSPDILNYDYYYGSSGIAYLAGSWGQWYLDDLPSGDYEVRVSDGWRSQDTYSLSSIY